MFNIVLNIILVVFSVYNVSIWLKIGITMRHYV